MVCTGAKSEKAAKQAVNKVVRQLRKRGIAVASKPLVKIQNIVASASLDGEVDLENAVYKLGKIIYAPEQFPGAVYRMDYPKVVFLIFSSGKIVSVGAKKEQEVYEAIEKFKKILQEKSLILSRRNSSQISILNKNNFG